MDLFFPKKYQKQVTKNNKTKPNKFSKAKKEKTLKTME